MIKREFHGETMTNTGGPVKALFGVTRRKKKIQTVSTIKLERRLGALTDEEVNRVLVAMLRSRASTGPVPRWDGGVARSTQALLNIQGRTIAGVGEGAHFCQNRCVKTTVRHSEFRSASRGPGQAGPLCHPIKAALARIFLSDSERRFSIGFPRCRDPQADCKSALQTIGISRGA